MNPNHAQAVHALSKYYYQKCDFDMADAISSHLIKVNSEWDEPYKTRQEIIEARSKSKHLPATILQARHQENLDGKVISTSVENLFLTKLSDAGKHFSLGNLMAKSGKFKDAICHYEQAIALKPEILETHYEIFWDVYTEYVKLVSANKGYRIVDPDFTVQGFKQGILPKTLVSNFLKSLQTAKAKEFVLEDCVSGYLPNKLPHSLVEALRCHTFFSLGSEQIEKFNSLINKLLNPITDCLGTPWRVVNTITQKTPASVIEAGPNDWHLDAFPLNALKILIYLTGAGPEIGTTELELEDGSKKMVEGPPGTWLLFNNSELLHRGIAPTKGERIIIQLTIAPSLTHDLQPIFPGLNARHPLAPWLS